VAKLLLDKGGNMDAQGCEYGDALQLALYGDLKQIVELLIDIGTETNAQGGFYGNALQVASLRGGKLGASSQDASQQRR
jgi:hypothetical protein